MILKYETLSDAHTSMKFSEPRTHDCHSPLSLMTEDAWSSMPVNRRPLCVRHGLHPLQPAVTCQSMLATPHEGNIVVPILKMGKIKYREVKSITQNLTACELVELGFKPKSQGGLESQSLATCSLFQDKWGVIWLLSKCLTFHNTPQL